MKNKMPAPSDRAKVKVMPKRSHYEKETIYKILDAAFVCHIGFVADGSPFAIPVVYGRKDDKIYFHGGKGSRMLKTVKKGDDICATVTLLDGFVLARSAFHHSVNYRSVVAFGKAVEITNRDEKLVALRSITNHLFPGRWEEVRIPNEKELNATTVLSFNLKEASAKMRTGPVSDDEADMDFSAWAGIIPVHLVPSDPIPDDQLNELIKLPDYIRDLPGRMKSLDI